MASIAEWIEKIKTAIYGEEVRGAIWQSLEAMNNEVEAINVDEEQIQTNKTNIATNTAAITALNSRTFWRNQIADVTISANSDTVLTLTKSTKAFIFIASANPAVCGVFICSASTNSNVAFLPVLLGSALSLSADGNKLTITNSSTSVAYTYGFIVDGSGITA